VDEEHLGGPEADAPHGGQVGERGGVVDVGHVLQIDGALRLPPGKVVEVGGLGPGQPAGL
jgi:hypothetical protein